MTKLQCSAVHCEYNSEQRCCRPDIKVGGGHEAQEAHETCCDSFRERGNQATNKADYCHPDTSLRVGCTATKCVYNDDGNCNARAIQIGTNSACKKHDTVCNTFACESCGCHGCH